jgi:hypothetical protein
MWRELIHGHSFPGLSTAQFLPTPFHQEIFIGFNFITLTNVGLENSSIKRQ